MKKVFVFILTVAFWMVVLTWVVSLDKNDNFGKMIEFAITNGIVIFCACLIVVLAAISILALSFAWLTSRGYTEITADEYERYKKAESISRRLKLNKTEDVR